jgi:hypothetical protein
MIELRRMKAARMPATLARGNVYRCRQRMLNLSARAVVAVYLGRSCW